MIQERTKFYSGLDKKQYMDKVTKEFIDTYESYSEKKTLNKMNIEIVQLINEYFEKYVYFKKLTTVIVEFLKSFYGNKSNYVSNFYSIKSSCKKQSELVMVIKRCVKKYPLNTKYYAALKYDINKIMDRLDYLLGNVVFSYVEMTPLLDYMKMLESNGSSLELDISENIDFDETFQDNPEVNQYIQRVLSSLNISDEEYLLKKKAYEEFLERKYAKFEEEKLVEKEKAKEKRYSETEAKLQKTANNVRRTIFSGNVEGSSCSSIVILGRKFSELKKKGEKNARIIFVGKTHSGSRAATHYLSENGLTQALSKARVFGENEKLPEEIQKLIDSKDYASAEILIPL